MACAGHGHHHTEGWKDPDHEGVSCVDRIQKAADDAAEFLRNEAWGNPPPWDDTEGPELIANMNKMLDSVLDPPQVVTPEPEPVAPKPFNACGICGENRADETGYFLQVCPHCKVDLTQSTTYQTPHEN